MISSDPQFIPMHHVSVGDLLRGLGSAGPDIAAYNNARKVLPGDEVVPIIMSHVSGLLKHDTPREGARVILLDGFPRSLEQEAAAAEPLASLSLSAEFPDIALYFECPKEVLMERYLKRGRGNDNQGLFEKRIEQHQKECQAVLELYKKRDILIEVSTQLLGQANVGGMPLIKQIDRYQRRYQ
jgi:UMP-CMP kinase